MDFDGDAGFEGFNNMGGNSNMNFNMGNMGGGNGGSTKFFMNGQDMSGMGIDPNQLFSMFMNRGDDDFGGFGGFGGMKGANKPKGGNRGQSQSKKFGGFQGFGNFGGFGQEGSNFNFA